MFFFLSSQLCANLSYILHWHVLPKLVLLLIRLPLENQTKHDTALHHLAWWCHDVINILLTLRPHLPPGMCQRLVTQWQVYVCVCKSVTFFGGWVVTGHVFKTPPSCCKVEPDHVAPELGVNGGLCLWTVHSLSLHNQVHPGRSCTHGRGVTTGMVGASGLRCWQQT